VNPVELLKALPPTSVLEGKLRAASGLLVNSEAAKVLAKYSKARAALARTVAEASAKAYGLAIAAADEEMTPVDAARVARECAAYLEALVS
jgi:hypothetical protein